MTLRQTLCLLPVLAMMAVLVAACTAAGIGSPALSPSAAPTVSPPAVSTGSPPAATAAATAVAALEPWREIAMRDVRSGERFTIAELAGKLVVIEPMAIWCTNCASQQKEASKALAALDSNDIVYISLDVDPSEAEADLAAYADERGFDWRFVVAGRELSRALAQAFGDQVLSPPSTPKIIVTPDGQALGPDFGIANADAVEAELRDHLS